MSARGWVVVLILLGLVGGGAYYGKLLDRFFPPSSLVADAETRVPALQGLLADQATFRLEASGLVPLVRFGSAGQITVGEGTVFDVQPAEGTPLARGSQVFLLVHRADGSPPPPALPMPAPLQAPPATAPLPDQSSSVNVNTPASVSHSKNVNGALNVNPAPSVNSNPSVNSPVAAPSPKAPAAPQTPSVAAVPPAAPMPPPPPPPPQSIVAPGKAAELSQVVYSPFPAELEPLRVQPLTGNLQASFVDLRVPDGPRTLDLIRGFDSIGLASTRLGAGWRFQWERILTGDGPQVVVRSPGESLVLDWDDRALQYRSRAGDVVEFSDQGATHSLPRGMVHRYDLRGRLVQVEQGNRPLAKLTYSAAGHLERIDGASGGSITLTANGAGRLIEARGSDGSRVRYVYGGETLNPGGDTTARIGFLYHEDGRLAEVVRPDQARIRLTYDPQGRVVSLARGARVERFEYGTNERSFRRIDAAGRADTWQQLDDRTVLTDPAGQQTISQLDPQTRLFTVQTPNTARWQFTFDEEERLVRSVDPLAKSTFYGYVESTGRPAFRIAADGRRTDYAYDDEGRLISSSAGGAAFERWDYQADGALLQRHEPGSPPSQLRFDAQDRISEWSDAGGLRRLEYDARGELTRIEQPAGGATQFAYDAAGRLTSAVDPTGGKTLFEYDALGRLVQETDPLGQTMRLAYDETGRVAQLVLPNQETVQFQFDERDRVAERRSSTGAVVRYEYDEQDNLVSTTDGQGARWTFAYDVLGRVVEEVNPLGHRRRFEYDHSGNVVALIDPLGRRIEFSYDLLDRLVSTKDSAGRVHRWEYDAAGRLAATIDPMNRRISVDRQEAGLPIAIRFNDQVRRTIEWGPTGPRRITGPAGVATDLQRDPAGRIVGWKHATGEATRAVYDEAGRVVEAADAQGRAWKLGYTSTNQLTSLETPDRTPFRFEYDAAGQLLALQGPGGPLRRFAYDPLGRRTATHDGLGRATHVHYVDDEQIAAVELADGTQVKLHYDALEQCVKVEPAQGPAIEMTYDAMGNLLSQQRGEIGARYRYDELDRLVEVTRLPSRTTIRYEYDTADRRVALEIDQVGRWTYAYDERDRLVSMTTPTQQTSRFAYDEADRLVRQEWPNGIVVTQTFDTRGRAVQFQAVQASGQVLFGRTDEYNDVGNLVRQRFHDGRETVYEYDALDRLIAARGPEQQETFTYDALGNRLQADNGATYDAGQQVQTFGGETFRHDALGQLTERTRPEGAITYAYDAGQLSEVRRGDAVLARYAYDGSGKRVARTVDGETRYQHYDGDQLLLETDAQGRPLEMWIPGPVRYAPVGMTAGGSAFYPLVDAQGTTVMAFDAEGRAVAEFRYSAFGEPINQAPEKPLPIRRLFAGCPLDPATGLYRAALRDYDPRLGRFLTPDPFLGEQTNPASWHPYQYAFNNPLRYRDPSGAVAEDIAIALSNTLGGLGQTTGEWLGWGVGNLATSPAQVYNWVRGDTAANARINRRIESFSREVAGPALNITTQLATAPVTEPLRLGSSVGEASVNFQQGNYGRGLLNVGGEVLRVLPMAAPFASGAFRASARQGLSNLANSNRASRVYTAQGNVDNILKVRYRLPVAGKSPRSGTDGRIWGLTEGGVYAGNSANRWANTRSPRLGDTPFEFMGEAAKIFKIHEVWGPFSLIKRLGGQHKGGFGDIRILEWVRGPAGQVIVSRAELLAGQFAGQSWLKSASRLWGRRLLDLGLTGASLALLDLLHESGQYEKDRSLVSKLINALDPSQPPKTVPNVVGFPLAGAVAELRKAELGTTFLKGTPAQDAKRENQVYWQDPAGGTSAANVTSVRVMFHTKVERKTVQVPNLLTMSREDAEKALADEKLKLVAAPRAGEKMPSPSNKRQEVYEQSPPGDTDVYEGSTVRFTYYAGIKVKDYVGKKRKEASELITKDLMVPKVEKGDLESAEPTQRNRVYQQKPLPGEYAWFGDTIEAKYYGFDEGFRPGDGGKVDGRFGAAKVMDTDAGERTKIHFDSGPQAMNNETMHFLGWTITAHAGAGEAAKQHAQTAGLFAPSMSVTGLTITTSKGATDAFSRANLKTDRNWSSTYMRSFVYRGRFVISFSHIERVVGADYSGEAARVIEASQKLIDLRFPPDDDD